MKHVLPRLLRPEAPGGTWTSGKTGRGRKEVRGRGGEKGNTVTLEDSHQEYVLCADGLHGKLGPIATTLLQLLFPVRKANPGSWLSPCLCLCLWPSPPS